MSDLSAPRPGMPTPDPRMFHGYLGDVVRVVDPTTEADPVGVLLSLLATFGACVGPGRYVRVGASKQGARLWPLLIGPTGSGRKGTAWSVASTFFAHAGGEHFLRFNTVNGGLSTGEGFVNLVRDRPDDDGKVSRNVEQPTPFDRYNDKRRLIVEPEFARLLAAGRREGSTLSPVLRAAWDSGNLNVVTRTDPLVATNSHVSLIGHVTRRELVLKVSDTDISGGLLNRFLPLLVRQSKDLPLEHEADQQAYDALAAEWRHKVNGANTRTYMRRSETADELWADHLYRALKVPESDEDSIVGELLVRGHAYVMRLALTYALLDGALSIDQEHLLAAAAVWDYASASARAVWGAPEQESDVSRLAKLVQSAGEEGVTRSQASKLFSGHRSTGEIDALFGVLVTEGKARKTSRPTGGRPADVYVWCGPEMQRQAS